MKNYMAKSPNGHRFGESLVDFATNISIRGTP